MSDFRSQLQNFVHQLDQEDNAAFDLWTWLPSYRKAQEYHGDYAHEHRPSTACVLDEANEYINLLVKGKTTAEIDKMDNEWFECPCGEPHDDEV